MAYNQLFLDSDTLLDLFFERQPFSQYTQLLLAECMAKKINLNTSALIVANMSYIMSKRLGKNTSKEKIKELVELLNVLPFDGEAITFALHSDFTDFEDAIQHFIAKKHQCDLIITRNIKDYKNSTIPVFTPEQFLRSIL
ncbi:MAG: PIN domain-containing protein [Sphingobacteriaceae bacterium]|nr:MAG: PIN domain-containing protein [Sphingobacteriaceae bacterium]